MSSKTSYDPIPNVELDAKLVHAAMHGTFMHAAMNYGLKPDEALARAAWLKKQPDAYVLQVAEKVNALHSH